MRILRGVVGPCSRMLFCVRHTLLLLMLLLPMLHMVLVELLASDLTRRWLHARMRCGRVRLLMLMQRSEGVRVGGQQRLQRSRGAVRLRVEGHACHGHPVWKK